MKLEKLREIAKNKNNFNSIKNYVDFCLEYLEFIENNLQAVIVSQNVSNYRFFQYRADGHFNITRPINSNLIYASNESNFIKNDFIPALLSAKEIAPSDQFNREIIRRSIYTIQQAIGATLDALPAGESNTARKINGDLFERLIKLLIQETGVECRSGVINVPVIVDDKEMFKMSYQHDLLISQNQNLKIIGSVKTSSKDRIDKIFLDKFLYCKLTETAIPHVAIFLNDVQRKKTKKENEYGINSTFLSGHFKAFTVKLNPLDGVYYCDLLPSMKSDSFLSQRIKTIDSFFCDDLHNFLNENSKMIIAIDGPSGAGKSTLGKMLAKQLNLLYLDTGAMYRGVGLAVLENGVSFDDKERIAEIAGNSKIELVGEPENLQVFLNGKDVSAEIRTNEVGQAASIVSTISEVRKILVEHQRKLGEESKNGAVLDGRDIGTVVFPNADLKFFLTAKPEARAHRRYEEDLAKNRATSFEQTFAEIRERDERDVSRADSPLSIAEDAIVIDTSELNLTEVYEQMLEIVREMQKLNDATL